MDKAIDSETLSSPDSSSIEERTEIDGRRKRGSDLYGRRAIADRT